MYMIEIEESKIDKMSNLVEDMLNCGGRLMSWLEGLGSNKERETSDRKRDTEERYCGSYSHRSSRY